jgi:hypothetical protein
MNDVFRGYGVEVDIISSQNFLKIRETLSRIGIASKKDKILYQSCHILHKQGRYAIVHFKELYGLDGNDITFDGEDEERRNTIAKLLQEWNLIKIIQTEKIAKTKSNLSNIKVLTFTEKPDWILEPKYVIGKKPKRLG